MRVACLALGALFLSGPAFAASPSASLDACSASVPVTPGDRIVACSDVIGSGASLYEAYVWRAAAYVDNGNRPAAEADLSAAIALSPDAAPAYSARGALYLKDERFRDGLVDLDRALVIAPADEGTLRTRAFAWDTLQNYPSAIADYGALLTLTGDETYRYFRGFAYLHHGDDGLALADFAAILGSKSPTLSAWGHRGQGAVHEREGQLTAALDDYNAALTADPSDDRAFIGRCRVGAALGQSGNALAGCTGALHTAAATP